MLIGQAVADADGSVGKEETPANAAFQMLSAVRKSSSTTIVPPSLVRMSVAPSLCDSAIVEMAVTGTETLDGRCHAVALFL